MVRNLVRYDAARREVVKQRVDAWVKDNNVLTLDDLSSDEKGYATMVRLDLNRSKYGTELKEKGTTFLSIWSQRFYPLKARAGTNTFEVLHAHESDFPKVWPVYRMRIVHDPSNVAQPVGKETKVGPGGEADDERASNLDNMKKRDDRIYKEIREKEEKEKAKELNRLEKEQQVEAGVKYDSKARINIPPPRARLARNVNVQFEGKYTKVN
jgi:hypothetical protein